jgi:sugar phosphate isomerase/epimerase
MRLGGRVFEKTCSPREWVAAVKTLGYRAAYCPIGLEADDATIRAYADAAKAADIVIAEVGAWSNPISADEQARKNDTQKCIRNLALAEKIGAACCVNIAGSRGPKWNGPHPDNLKPETFDLIVQTLRAIIDAVKPTRTAYTLETMGWGFPDSAESYLDLIRAVDRRAFGVHFDPINLINCPRRYYDNARFMREAIGLLGPHIRSCHVKDVTLGDKHLIHLDECRPGTGALDLATYLRELARLPADLPLMLEHLPNAEEYRLAAEHLRALAAKEGVTL